MYRSKFSFVKYLSAFVLLITGGNSFSQQAVVDKFNAYGEKALQEKIFLHTDKEFYVTGEILWFKVYYANGTTNKPMQLSKIAYAEVLNEKNEPVLQAKISLKPGENNGSFYLPTSLNTGNYIIRAYTNWMKNFDAGYFFEKRIAIINTLKAPDAAPAKDSLSSATINFFPEGGNLVRDIESKVGFIIADRKGGINDCRGYIIKNNTDTVTSFSPLQFGIGNFVFTPLSGNSYKAIVTLPGGSVISKALPEVYDNGYVLKVKDNGNDQLEITVQRKKMPTEGNTEQILLTAHTRQVLSIAERALINDNNPAVFFIDKNKLAKGVTHFTLFSSNEKPLCERLFYIKPGAVSLKVQSDKATYTNRESVTLSLNTQYNTNTTPFNLSASVFKLDTLQKAAQSTIVDYMWLASDIAGGIESPEYYFSNDPNVNVATDNLMLTHGWRRFKWDDVLAGGTKFIKYLPEIYGQLITARIRDTRNDQTVANTDVYLSIPGQPFGFYSAKSDNNGIVRFEVKDYYGNRQVIAQPGIETDSFYKVEIIKPFAETEPVNKYASYQLSEEVKDQLLQKSIAMQVQNIYSGDSLRNFDDPVIADTLPFFGRPEMEYKLDNYKRFTTMEEVLREYVSEINVVVRNGKLALKIFNPDAHDFYDGYALVMLDGVVLHDANKIFTYDPLKVKKLDVIQTRYVLGQATFNGVASFSTYEGAFDGFELDPRIIAIDYAGLQLQREFYSPAYETKEQLESRIPDFRNTLLWSPDINTDKEGKATLRLYSSDRTGKYIVIVQGMNQDGEFVYGTTTFEVK